MKKQTIRVGDKVTFQHGFGKVVGKRKDTLGYSYVYDVELIIGNHVATASGFINDDSETGRVYTTRYVQKDSN